MQRLSDGQLEELKPLCDPVAERLIVSCLVDNGESVLFDIDTYCKPEHFYHPENRILFEAVQNLVVQEKVAKPSVVAILASIDTNTKEQYSLSEYLPAILVDKLLPTDLKPLCLKVARYGIARKLRTGLLQAAYGLNGITGDERITEIIGRAEQPIISVTNNIFSQQNDVVNLGAGLAKYLELLIENPNPYRGIPSGFRLWDKAIGGGLRRSGFQLVCGRPKAGKSFFGLNVAHNVTKVNIPVLYLDTELTETMTTGRWLSRIAEIETEILESGAFVKDKRKLEAVKNAIAKAEEEHKNFHYVNISGRSHTEWLSIIRRWVTTKVGFGPDGRTKDCLVIVDYIKMMDSSELKKLQEYQYLGQIATDLHNICVTYDISMLCLGQLNRDGIGNDDQGAVAGSDRLTQLCSSLTFLRLKDREVDADDMENGDRKLVPICTRFGGGLEGGGYINLITNLAMAKMEEGRTNHQNRAGNMTLEDDEKIKM